MRHLNAILAGEGWRGNLNEPIFESNARGIGCRGGMLKLRINRRTTCLLLSCFSAMIGQFLNDIKVFFNQRATYRHQFRVTESEKSSSHWDTWWQTELFKGFYEWISKLVLIKIIIVRNRYWRCPVPGPHAEFFWVQLLAWHWQDFLLCGATNTLT